VTEENGINSKPSKKAVSLSLASAGFLFGFLFDPDDGGDMFFLNFGLSELRDVADPKTPLFSN
jgi:hypothetical protein